MASIYGKFFVQFEGSTMSENVTLEIKGEGNEQDVYTTVKGWAGQAGGAKKLIFNLKDAIPAKGPWKKIIWNAWASERVVSMRFLDAGDGSALDTKGFIRAPGISSGVNQASEMSYELHAEPAVWE